MRSRLDIPNSFLASEQSGRRRSSRRKLERRLFRGKMSDIMVGLGQNSARIFKDEQAGQVWPVLGLFRFDDDTLSRTRNTGEDGHQFRVRPRHRRHDDYRFLRLHGHVRAGFEILALN